MKINLLFISILAGCGFFCLSCMTNNQSSPGSDSRVSIVSDHKAKLGEGSLWDSKRQILYYIDIEEGILFEYDPVTDKIVSHKTGRKVGTVVPESDTTVVLALQDGIYRMYLHNDSLEFIARPSSLLDNQRFNDGKCDPLGRFWVGSMASSKSAFLYCLDNEARIHEILDSISISNGIIWSPDSSKMYYTDTPTGKIWQFDFNKSDGSISGRKIVIEVPDSLGAPDGMTIDSEGKLWVAFWGGSGVYQCDPSTGEILQKIEVPAKNVTSCAFGGPDLDILFITTASIGMNEEETKQYPDAGKLFSIKMKVKGIPSNYITLANKSL
ncbi:MAG: SMP-30/gluconolactonase/LRE family protein [Bacteroidales bacterium]|nr:SMP-30/gluconolactonase/LRE family protein [Bacteroidales bacterium]